MKTTAEIQKLWELIGEIGCIAENTDDGRLWKLYEKLSHALDYAEESGLIEYKEGNEHGL